MLNIQVLFPLTIIVLYATCLFSYLLSSVMVKSVSLCKSDINAKHAG